MKISKTSLSWDLTAMNINSDSGPIAKVKKSFYQ